MSNEQMREAIVVLLDAADEWSNYVDADHAPVSLRKYMEREAEQIISSLPVEVSMSADADAMNITHGESYGSDWVYPTDSSAAPGPAPQGVAEVMERIPNAARLYYTGSPTRRYCRASTTKGPGEPLVFRDLAEREIRRLVQERDAHRAALDPAVAEIVKLKARIAELEVNYHELLYAVAHKHPDETRHQTALRYIMQAEKAHGPQAAGAAVSSKEPRHG